MALPTVNWVQAQFQQLLGLIDMIGEDVVIIEHVQGGPNVMHPALKAKPQPMKTEDLFDGSPAKQGDLFLLCRADRFPVARRLEQRDRIRFRGRDFAIINDDANQYSIGGVVLVRRLHVRG